MPTRVCTSTWVEAQEVVEEWYLAAADVMPGLSLAYTPSGLKSTETACELSILLWSETGMVGLLQDWRGNVWLTQSTPGAGSGRALQVSHGTDNSRLIEACMVTLGRDDLSLSPRQSH